jgi:uncharacterized membrane protein
MSEMLIILVVLALLVGFGVCIFVLPVIAIIRTRHIREIRTRLARMEEAVRRTGPAGTPPDLAELRTRLERLEQRLAPEDRAETVPLPAEPVPAPPQPRPRPAAPARAEEPAWALPVGPQLSALDAVTVEGWIGRHALGWVAVLLLLFATGFFLKYAFDNEWIGELGQVTIGVLAGVALCVTGWRYHVRGWRVFSQMLTAGGIVLLYLATYGSFGYYHLLSREAGAVFLILLIAEAAALAVIYEAPAIALMAVVGGLLNPILLHTGHDQYQALFRYLLLLNAGSVGLALFRRWHAVGTVALVGTQALFWGWYGEHYHPEKLAAALTFQVALFALFLAYSIAAHVVRPRRANIEDLVRFVLNACLFAAAGYVLLDEDYHTWMGTAAVGMATVYAVLGWFVLRERREDERQLLVVVATAMGFVAAVFPLQAEAAWIPVGWAVQGAALWWFGLRVRSEPLRALGGVLLALAVGRLVFVDTPYTGREPFVPIFNKYGLPAFTVAACLLAVAAVSRRWSGRLGAVDGPLALIAGLGGFALVWLILSVETYTYFTAQMRLPGADVSGLEQTAQTALSVVWAAYAAVLLALGFWLRVEALRWAALGLFGLTLAKVVLVDMAGLPGLYRVAAFLVLSLMMGAAAWGYQKVQRLTAARARP